MRYLGGTPEDPCLDHPESSNSFYQRNYLADPRYFEDTCCYPPTFPLPTCRKLITGTVKTKTLDQATKDRYTDMSAGTPRFIAVGPDPKSKDGCGRITKTIDDSGLSCCQMAPQLIWDAADSVAVISDGTSGAVFFTGGLGPYTITANGTGFWMDAAHTKKSIRTSAKAASVYTRNSCGKCVVTVKDSCGSIVTGKIRSTVGQWVKIYDVHNDQEGGGQTYPQYCTAESVKEEYKVAKESFYDWVMCKAFDATVIPLCANWAINPSCGDHYTSAIARMTTTFVPPVGHDPGTCVEQRSYCSDVNYWYAYCTTGIIYPGINWHVWEWQC